MCCRPDVLDQECCVRADVVRPQRELLGSLGTIDMCRGVTPKLEPRGSTNSGGQPAAAASPAKASMYAGPGGDRKPGKAWGWPAYALQQACAGVLGIVIVDLVFDFQEPEVARAYYAVMRAPRVVFF